MSFVDLKEFAGQPWYAWTEYIGLDSPPELEEDDFIIQQDELSGTMRLNKSDMGIYGQYPGAEPFELAVCEFCGDKFKLAALAEHIGLRHQDGKKSTPDDVSSITSSKTKFLQIHLQKKGKSRHGKHGKECLDRQFVTPSTPNKVKPKQSDDVKGKAIVILENPTKLEKVKPNPHLSVPVEKSENLETPAVSSLLKDDSVKLKQLKLKLKKSDKSSSQLPPPKLVNNKVLKNGGWNHAYLANHKVKEKLKGDNSLKKGTVKEDSTPNVSEPEKNQASEDISKMQPVVQLSPLDYPSNPLKTHPGSPEAKKRVKNEKKAAALKDRTYNPDRHCGVIGKENTKPCTRSITCKSHSMSSRRAVIGRSKDLDVLLADYKAEKEKEIFKRKIVGSHSINHLNSTIKMRSPSNRIMQKSNQLVNSSFELHKLKSKSGRNMKSVYPRLSLPVSIKNPNNMFAQFQSSNDEKSKGIYATLLGNGGVNPLKILGSSSILKKQILNPLLTRQDNINGALTKNTHHPAFHIQYPPRPLAPKPTSFKVGDLFRQWYPGFRRNGGLLYSNNQIPKLNGTRPIAPKLDAQNVSNMIDSPKAVPSHVISVVQSKPTFNSSQNGPSSSPEIVKIPLTYGQSKKKAVETLNLVKATNSVVPVNLNGKSLLNSQQAKLTTVVKVNSVQFGLVSSQIQSGKRKGDELNTINQMGKIRKYGKSEANSIASKNSFNGLKLSIIEKSISTSSPIPFTAASQLQPGACFKHQFGLLRNLTTHPMTQMTSSGPHPVRLQHLPILPQAEKSSGLP